MARMLRATPVNVINGENQHDGVLGMLLIIYFHQVTTLIGMVIGMVIGIGTMI